MGVQQLMMGATATGPAPNPGWAWATAVNLQAIAGAPANASASLTIAGTAVVGMQGTVTPSGSGAFGPFPAGTDGAYLQVYLQTASGSMSGTDTWRDVITSPSWSLPQTGVGATSYTGTMLVRRTTDNTQIGSFSVSMTSVVTP